MYVYVFDFNVLAFLYGYVFSIHINLIFAATNTLNIAIAIASELV